MRPLAVNNAEPCPQQEEAPLLDEISVSKPLGAKKVALGLVICLGLIGFGLIVLPTRKAHKSTSGALSQKYVDLSGGELTKKEFHIRWTIAPKFCLDVPYANAYDGQTVQTYRCRPGDGAQLWINRDGQIAFKKRSDLCLTRDGNEVKLRKCTKSADQSLKVSLRDYAEQSLVHLREDDSKCLQVKCSIQHEAQSLEFGDCETWRSDQFFTFWAVESPIRWAHGHNKCLQVRGGQKVHSGLPIELWECQPGNERQMFLYDLGDSNRIHLSMDPNYCLDFNHDAKPAWAENMAYPLQAWFCGSHRSQTFWKSPAQRTKLTNEETKLCVDVFEGGDYNGNMIQAWKCTDGSKHQDFDFAAGPVDFSCVTAPKDGNDKSHERGKSAEGHDVIVVGAGLMGSIVASDLAKRMPDKKILLVEAGAASQSELGGELPPSKWQHGQLQKWDLAKSSLLEPVTRYDVPGNYIKGLHCWNEACRDSWGHELGGIQQCKVLGGCGVMNGALMQLVHPDNFNSWPEGWRAQDLEPFVKRAEKDFHITQIPSADGQHYLDDAGGNFVRQAFEKFGGPAGGFVEDNTTQPRGGIFHIPHVSAKNGVRQSTALMYLPEAMERPNFKLLLMKQAIKIESVAGTQATGLRVQDEETGIEETLKLKADGLLVLTAGAINTPRLLLRSGMTAFGAVGKTISDHSLWHQKFRCLHGSDPKVFGEVTQHILSQYLDSKSGPLAQFGPIFTGFWKDPRTPGGNERYDIEYWMSPQEDPGLLALQVALMRETCSDAKMALNFDGTIRLEGAPRNGCDYDITTMQNAMNWLDHMLGSAGCHKEGPTEHNWAFNHWAGSCALGACVNPDTLLVHGTRNVAVADASITPTTIWGHPALTLKGIAFKAADTLASANTSPGVVI